MDPNEVLKWARESVKKILEDEYQDEIANELAEQFRSLDEWLSKGGFLPKDWQPLKAERQS